MKNQGFHGLLFAVLALTMTAPGFAFAERGRNRAPDPGRFMDQMVQELDLSNQQKEQIAKMREVHQAKMQSLREKSRAAADLYREKMKSDASEAELRKAHDEKLRAREEMARARFENALELRKILTKEQRKALNEKMEERKSWRKDRRGPRGPADSSEDLDE